MPGRENYERGGALNPLDEKYRLTRMVFAAEIIFEEDLELSKSDAVDAGIPLK